VVDEPLLISVGQPPREDPSMNAYSDATPIATIEQFKAALLATRD
jgi:hypothetical protein